MHRYYFDVDEGTGPLPDDEGIVFLDQETGEREAVRLLADIAAEIFGMDVERISVELRDERGSTVFTACLVLTMVRH